MRAVLVANGELTDHARLKEIWLRANLRLAADGGARNARLHLRIAPHVVIGDLDSLDDETRQWLEASSAEFIRLPPGKDKTDLELALDLAHARGADDITILGAFGGRVDQFLANVFLLTDTRSASGRGIRIADANGEMWIGGGDTIIEGKRGDIVSLIPLDTRVEGIVTDALEYPLRGETLTRGSTRGISNVMLSERAAVHWSSGTLLIVHLPA
jgi:thiamine pyrophosphokinase